VRSLDISLDICTEFWGTTRNLSRVVEEFDPSKIRPFPPFDGSRFAGIIDEAMGFI
jgi:beta-1,4-N-acetylglucosaminyltransferase